MSAWILEHALSTSVLSTAAPVLLIRDRLAGDNRAHLRLQLQLQNLMYGFDSTASTSEP